MALREVDRFETFSFPVAYSFWASIITSTESEVDAVDGGIPRMSVLKEGVELDIMMQLVMD